MEIEAKIMTYSILLPCWKFGMSFFFTRWIHTAVCVMTVLTDKVAQVINQWENCLKFMVTHRIYKNDGDI